jgi:hypothetical protein
MKTVLYSIHCISVAAGEDRGNEDLCAMLQVYKTYFNRRDVVIKMKGIDFSAE